MSNDYYDAADVRESISGKMETIISDIFPNGRKTNGEIRVGSLDGEKGKSLAISLNGSKMGRFYDHNSGDKGDIFTILSETKGLDYPEAVEFLAENYTSCIKRPFEKENLRPKEVVNAATYATAITPEIIAYAQETRKVSEKTLTNYQIGANKHDPTVMALPHFQSGHLAKLAFSATREKSFWAEGPAGNGLFGANYVTPKMCSGVLTITEGQWDAMSYAEAGIPAVSIPAGVQNNKWIESMWEYLQSFHTILLSYDMDEAGQESVEEVVKRLGVNKCLLVSLPEKDASDMLQKGLKDELIKAHSNPKPPEKTDIVSAAELEDEVIEMLQTDFTLVGEKYFIPGFDMRIRDYEMTLVYGRNHAGKSMFVSGQIAYDAAKGIPYALASFEQQPTISLSAITLQYLGKGFDKKKEQEFREAYRKMAEYVYIYKKMERPTPSKVLEEFEYYYRRRGVRRFVIDNMTTLDIPRDDNKATADALDQFRVFVSKYPVHLFLVAHPRKESRDTVGRPADRSDIRGASELSDIPQNVVLVHRHEEKTKTINQMKNDGGYTEQEIEFYDRETEDGLIMGQKNRLVGNMPEKKVWFDPTTKLFMGHRGRPTTMRELAESQEPDLRGEVESTGEDYTPKDPF